MFFIFFPFKLNKLSKRWRLMKTPKMLNLYQIHTTDVSPVDAFITFRSLVLFIARLASHVIKSLLKLKMQNINNRKRMLQIMQTYYISRPLQSAALNRIVVRCQYPLSCRQTVAEIVTFFFVYFSIAIGCDDLQPQHCALFI